MLIVRSRSVSGGTNELRTLDRSHRRPEVSGALLKITGAFQDHGPLLIENLIGKALAISVAQAVARGRGELTPEEVAILKRGEALKGQVGPVMDFTTEILPANPQMIPKYLETLVEHGELKAVRRGYMDYLVSRGAGR